MSLISPISKSGFILILRELKDFLGHDIQAWTETLINAAHCPEDSREGDSTELPLILNKITEDNEKIVHWGNLCPKENHFKY